MGKGGLFLVSLIFVQKQLLRNKLIVRLIPATIFFFITFYLFTLPGKSIPKVGWMEEIKMDKLVHIGLFTTSIILWCFPLKKTTLDSPSKIFWALFISFIGICYGIAIEYIQKYYIVGRSFDLFDIVADSIGCIIGYIVTIKYFKLPFVKA
jgi:hypothetical protein